MSHLNDSLLKWLLWIISYYCINRYCNEHEFILDILEVNIRGRKLSNFRFEFGDFNSKLIHFLDLAKQETINFCWIFRKNFGFENFEFLSSATFFCCELIVYSGNRKMMTRHNLMTKVGDNILLSTISFWKNLLTSYYPSCPFSMSFFLQDSPKFSNYSIISAQMIF